MPGSGAEAQANLRQPDASASVLGVLGHATDAPARELNVP
jgi:hypothetical protein